MCLNSGCLISQARRQSGGASAPLGLIHDLLAGHLSSKKTMAVYVIKRWRFLLPPAVGDTSESY